MSVSIVIDWPVVVVNDSVGVPCWCSLISIGMQVVKGTGAEVVVDAVAKTPVKPGSTAVTKPVEFTVATEGSIVPHVSPPTRLVMSLAFGAQRPVVSGGCATVEQAAALNCCVKVVEVQPVTGLTITEVTAMWTVTGTGALVTPPALAVMVADPEMGLPLASSPSHVMKFDSQTPAQTSPEGDTPAIARFDDAYVTVTPLAVPLAVFGVAVICTTCPEFNERPVGETVTEVTVVLGEEPPPPHPVKIPTSTTMEPRIMMMPNRLIRPPRLGLLPWRLIK
jgi:hypothetical protein